MRISPTRVTFNYPRNTTPPHIYSPRIVQSGYIVGEPLILANTS